MEFFSIPKDYLDKEKLQLILSEINPSLTVGNYLKQVNFTLLNEFAYILENDKAQCIAALYNNPFLSADGKRLVPLGNIEAKNNSKAFSKLICELEKQVSAQKVQFLAPMNGTTWDSYRFHKTTQKEYFTGEMEHPDFYPQLLKDAGFKPIAVYDSKRENEIPTNQAKVLKLEQHFKEMGLNIRPFDLENFDQELEKIYPFVNKAFEENLFFSPISFFDFFEKYSALKPLFNPKLVLLAEYQNDIVGFIFCYPNFNNTSTKEIIVKTIARKNEEPFRGLGHVLANIALNNAKELGFSSCIHAFMLQDGFSTGVSEAFSGKAFKEYELFSKEVR